MKSLGQLFLSEHPFSEIVMGNTALVRAMIESGTRVVTSYPGSPTPEIAEAIRLLPHDKRPFYFEFSTNEKVATEVAFGASINGHLSCVFFKSVGLNVAADSFVQLALMELIGGMVIILGDDPGANSSQNEQDNRHIARMSYTPVFEPSSPSEAYAMYKEAARLSQDKRIPVILRLSTHVCHGKEKVQFDSWTPRDYAWEPQFNREKNGPYVPITAQALVMKERALKKFESIRSYSDTSAFNIEVPHHHPHRGIITMGLPYFSLLDALSTCEKKPDIFRMGLVHPLPRQRIVEFLRTHSHVHILEELDDIVEKEIKAIAFEERIAVTITGKGAIPDWIGEYTPSKVKALLRNVWPDLLALDPSFPSPLHLAKRPPQMCPGCGHRSAFHAIKKILGPTDITVADIGCHTLGFLRPYQMGEVLLSMGASISIASGLAIRNPSRKVVAFMGDSTFFHAGHAGLVNAVFNNHNLTFVLLENGTTAMTGHQSLPSAKENANGETRPIPIRNVFEALGVPIYECDAYAQTKLIDLMKTAMAEPCLNVVIAKHPCMLKLTREQRRAGTFVDKHVSIGEACDQQYTCVEQFACPSFVIHSDGHVSVNSDLCIGDASCLQTCPSKAILPPKKKEVRS